MNERTNERTNKATASKVSACLLGGGGGNQTGISLTCNIFFIDPAFTTLPGFHFPQVTVPPKWASFIVRPVFSPCPAEREEP